MMRKLTYLLIFLCIGCSSSKVLYDYDLKTDFSKFKTYHYFDDAGEGMNQLDVKRFKRVIDPYLDSLGIKMADQPSYFINIISEKTPVVRNNIGFGIGGGGRNGGVGISTNTQFGGAQVDETITIDFVDASNNKLFWQGVRKVRVKERMKPEDRVLLVEKVVNQILANYPPKKGK
jgi:hypothetical protein